MVELKTGMSGYASAKERGATKILRIWDWSKAKLQGRWKRLGVQQWSRPAAADYGETWRYDGGGTFREPPHLLGGKW